MDIIDRANDLAEDERARNIAAANPDCEIVRVLHRQACIEAFLMIPRDKIAKAAHPPFWRHGETITVNPAPPVGM